MNEIAKRAFEICAEEGWDSDNMLSWSAAVARAEKKAGIGGLRDSRGELFPATIPEIVLSKICSTVELGVDENDKPVFISEREAREVYQIIAAELPLLPLPTETGTE